MYVCASTANSEWLIIMYISHQSIGAFTLATSESCQTGLFPFLKSDISRTTGTCQIPVSLLISTFKNGTKPVWHSSEVASVNTL